MLYQLHFLHRFVIDGGNEIMSISNTGTTVNSSLNAVGNATISGLSVFDMNITSTTIFDNLNTFSTNAQLSINNLNARSATNHYLEIKLVYLFRIY